MKTCLVLLISAIMVSGCQLTRVEGEVEGVGIKLDTNKTYKTYDYGHKFCPPGQAKKGRC
ncbi:hypothetical protein DI392_10235 [Vibrio albus]|uniref:Lipoprotein n=1 Tax=Vibrio albus TaxID=2200953 RepID=A0A2U3B9K5_9VIBR|nr:hypothetical protein [Vibrio albus]PWI33462.1 hypothetical protein DI392_10235 [Vibrio albus]